MFLFLFFFAELHRHSSSVVSETASKHLSQSPQKKEMTIIEQIRKWIRDNSLYMEDVFFIYFFFLIIIIIVVH